MQKAFDKMSMKAVDNHQLQPCVMCGDKRNSYEHCPLTQMDEEPEQVNYLNNKSSHFPRPPFNNPSSSNNRNFYHNASFNNSNNCAFQFDPPKPYIAPAVSDYMHEQGKMNQIMFEQMQAISAQLADLAAQNKVMEIQLSFQATSSQQQPGRLPSQPELNPRGEVKAITLRSGTHYQGPAMPTNSAAYHTYRANSAWTMQNPPVTETEHPDHLEPTRLAETIEYTDHAHSSWAVQKEVDSQRKKGTEKPPPYHPPILFPQRLAESRFNEQFANFIQVLKQLQILIPFTKSLTQTSSSSRIFSRTSKTWEDVRW